MLRTLWSEVLAARPVYATKIIVRPISGAVTRSWPKSQKIHRAGAIGHVFLTPIACLSHGAQGRVRRPSAAQQISILPVIAPAPRADARGRKGCILPADTLVSFARPGFGAVLRCTGGLGVWNRLDDAFGPLLRGRLGNLSLGVLALLQGPAVEGGAPLDR